MTFGVHRLNDTLDGGEVEGEKGNYMGILGKCLNKGIFGWILSKAIYSIFRYISGPTESL